MLNIGSAAGYTWQMLFSVPVTIGLPALMRKRCEKRRFVFKLTAQQDEYNFLEDESFKGRGAAKQGHRVSVKARMQSHQSCRSFSGRNRWDSKLQPSLLHRRCSGLDVATPRLPRHPRLHLRRHRLRPAHHPLLTSSARHVSLGINTCRRGGYFAAGLGDPVAV